MTRRYSICGGDKTSANGTVQTQNSSSMIGNRARAYENDPVWCESCKKMGRIVCVGPRLGRTGPDGRKAALSDDLCVCDCHPSPLLIASQNVSCMTV